MFQHHSLMLVSMISSAARDNIECHETRLMEAGVRKTTVTSWDVRNWCECGQTKLGLASTAHSIILNLGPAASLN